MQAGDGPARSRLWRVDDGHAYKNRPKEAYQMKKYERPSAEIELLREDIVTASGDWEIGEGGGDFGDLPNE